jgi:hypothetical protein
LIASISPASTYVLDLTLTCGFSSNPAKLQLLLPKKTCCWLAMTLLLGWPVANATATHWERGQ